MPVSRYKICCFIGSASLPVKEGIIRDRVREYVRMLIPAGVEWFALGGGPGFDILAMQELLAVKSNEKLPFGIMTILPFPRDPESMPREYRLDLDWFKRKSDRVLYASRRCYFGGRIDRDRKMLDRSGYCICCCKSAESEEAYMIRYAIKQGVWVRNTLDWDLKQL